MYSLFIASKLRQAGHWKSSQISIWLVNSGLKTNPEPSALEIDPGEATFVAGFLSK